MIYELDGIKPEVDESCWVAPNATVVGNVYLGRKTSVWWNAVLRGDNDRIEIHEESNIQDGCVLHTDPGLKLVVERGVTVGHKVMLHGCHIGEGSLVGIGAIILNGARIGRNCLIGAGSLIVEGKEIPDNSLVMGAPGRVIRSLSEAHAERMRMSTQAYVKNRERFAKGLKAL